MEPRQEGLDYKSPLAKSETLARKELIEVENDEAKSRLKMKLAKDKLLVYGLTEQEIEDAKNEDGVEKAKMILRARADGIVVKRTSSRGITTTRRTSLMTIAPLDHLWVRGSVSELDADKVEVGQKIQGHLPLFRPDDRRRGRLHRQGDRPRDPVGQVPRLDPNPEKKFKAGMFVRVLVEIPPKPGRTVIPRGSMVSVDRSTTSSSSCPGGRPLRARPIFVGQGEQRLGHRRRPPEEHLGLKPGEQVVTIGSLILEQMYEDRLMAEGESSTERPDG